LKEGQKIEKKRTSSPGTWGERGGGGKRQAGKQTATRVVIEDANAARATVSSYERFAFEEKIRGRGE